MAKTSFCAAFAAFFLSAVALHAQPAIVNSPSVKKARDCLDKIAAQGREAGFDTDRDGGDVLVLNRTRPEVFPLLTTMVECMDDAFPQNEVVKDPKTGTRSRIWYVSDEGQYAWCATNSLGNAVEDIDVLGGHGPQRDWYGIMLRCNIGEKILGFYEP